MGLKQPRQLDLKRRAEQGREVPPLRVLPRLRFHHPLPPLVNQSLVVAEFVAVHPRRQTEVFAACPVWQVRLWLERQDRNVLREY